jgi:hypothetical protein
LSENFGKFQSYVSVGWGLTKSSIPQLLILLIILNFIMDETFLQQILGCSRDEATHYLNIFNGDGERAVTVVLENRDDKSWWGHPWNAREDDSSEEVTRFDEENMVSHTCLTQSLYCDYLHITYLQLPQYDSSGSTCITHSSAVSEEKEDPSYDNDYDRSETHCANEYGEERLQMYNEETEISAQNVQVTKS